MGKRTNRETNSQVKHTTEAASERENKRRKRENLAQVTIKFTPGQLCVAGDLSTIDAIGQVRRRKKGLQCVAK